MAALGGGIFLAIDLLEKAGNFREASKLVMNFVFSQLTLVMWEQRLALKAIYTGGALTKSKVTGKE